MHKHCIVGGFVGNYFVIDYEIGLYIFTYMLSSGNWLFCIYGKNVLKTESIKLLAMLHKLW